jgi:hypothetical protein
MDEREQARNSREGGTMATSPISAASLGQYVLSAGTSQPLQQSLQALQSSLASGDLNGAQAAFLTVQKLSLNLTAASGISSSTSNSAQLTTDLTALGSALSAGNLTTATSAFATVQSDLNGSTSPSHTLESTLASQSEQLVAGLLGSLSVNTPSTSNPDTTTPVLEQVYGNRSGLNVTG